MSRVKKFTFSIVSGYALLGVNVIYTLASIPLALHYLEKEQFGLWALVLQASGYLLLLDLGMAGSIGRILIDHKDDSASTAYGSTILTGILVLLIQGALIALVGSLISYWVPFWMGVDEKFVSIFRMLLIWQCVGLGITFAGRIFVFILQAHQRYDIHNFAQVSGFVAALLGMWLGFKCQFGLYSLLLASVAQMACLNVCCISAVWLLGFLPARGRWGRPNWNTFRELFAYANDIFLLSVGQLLVTASQVIVVGRTLGLEAAAVWSVATKMFSLAQQMVARIFDFSAAALAEMMVRGERERLRSRFCDMIILTASVGTFLCQATLKSPDAADTAWRPFVCKRQTLFPNRRRTFIDNHTKHLVWHGQH